MLPFVKYHNLGNDFILIDDREKSFPLSKKIIQKLCNLHLGIGADGLILLQTSVASDFRMRIFNSDGSEAESCGNGLACLSLFIQHLTENNFIEKVAKTVCKNVLVANCQTKNLPVKEPCSKSQFTIETLAGEVKAEVEKSDPSDSKTAVVLNMPIFQILKKEVAVELDGRDFTFFYVNTGVDHAVTFVDNLNLDVNKIGKLASCHPCFAPDKTHNPDSTNNIDFAKKTALGIDLRVYERGVGQETLACGTGAIATAVAAFYLYNINPPILINFKHGSLKIDFEKEDKVIKNIKLTAFPKLVYSGNFLLD